jgi:pimeloyl-ACP methyl ester carboxylesterase
MATFVLVHGAWHGSWCWKAVREALVALGHDAFTPTLTGVGERSHLLSPEVTLDTHIDDVVNLIRWEELSDVVLCGHSYGGCVISGAADRIPERIAALVYLDAFVLEDGQSLHDTLPPEQRDVQLNLAQEAGEGWKVPPIPAEAFNVNPVDRSWVNSQCTMQSLATFTQPIKLTARPDVPPKHSTYILASGWNGSPFQQFYDRAKAKGWPTISIDCGHDVMLDKPEELTHALVGIAAAQPAAS